MSAGGDDPGETGFSVACATRWQNPAREGRGRRARERRSICRCARPRPTAAHARRSGRAFHPARDRHGKHRRPHRRSARNSGERRPLSRCARAGRRRWPRSARGRACAGRSWPTSTGPAPDSRSSRARPQGGQAGHHRRILRGRRNRHAGAALRRSDADRHVLLPDTHVAIVSAARIVAGMEEAFALVRSERDPMPRAVNLVSGPSRTGDIEQTIVLGAHGRPRPHSRCSGLDSHGDRLRSRRHDAPLPRRIRAGHERSRNRCRRHGRFLDSSRRSLPVARGRHRQKALAWVARAQRRERRSARDAPDFTALEQRILAILDSDERIPFVAKRGAVLLQLLAATRSTRAACGGARRSTSTARRSPRGRPCSTSTRSAKAEKENWVWHGADVPRARATSAAWSRSRAAAPTPTSCASSTSTTKAFVAGRLHAARGQEPGRLARTSTALFVGTDFGPGSLTELRLSADRQGVEARHAAGRGQPRLRGQARRRGRRRLPRPHARLRARLRRRAARPSTARDASSAATASSSRSTSPTTPRSSVHREWLLLELRTDWTVGGKTYPAAPLLATDFDGFLDGRARASTCCSSRAERTSLAGFSPTRHHVLLNELDNVRNRVYVADAASDGSWTREPLPAPPESARSTRQRGRRRRVATTTS